MKKIYTLLLALAITSLGFAQLNTGDIAFTAFNADGDDDFAIVALADIPANTTIYFTDREPDTGGTSLTSGEGTVDWNTGGAIITAGTVVVFTDTDSAGNGGFGASIGTLGTNAGGMNLAGGGDALFAFIGPDANTPNTFLAGIKNTASTAVDGPGFGDTGLTLGSTYFFFGTSSTPDGGDYAGNRDTEPLFSDYLALIANPANWTIDSGNGENLLPFDATAFSTSGGVNDTEVNFVGTSGTANEGDGGFLLEFSITNFDATNATSLDVVLTGGTGDAADINGYTTQTVTFPANDGNDQSLVLIITDDLDFEADETLTFEIQNVSGGLNAAAGSNSTFELTIENNDAPPTIAIPYSEDFSDCGAAAWSPFNENGTEVWTCAAGQYTMNGFPATDDRDWLISQFSIDFDAQANENIVVTTSEQFGDAINDPGEFQLVYSTDYAGFGNPTGATWTALTFDPNNTSTGFGASADSETTVDASGITGVAYLAFIYDASAGSGPEEWNITEVEVILGAPDTEVNFVGTSVNVAEDSGSYDLEFAITNEDATNATTFDVVLTAGDAADINGYTTVGVTFPAGSATNETLTITITDDMIEEGDETLTFEIQNVAGGNNATVGTNSSFDLTILANDVPALPGQLYSADFSNEGDGFPAHNSSSPPAAGPASAGPFGTAPNQWTLSYDTAPATDGTDNLFEVVGGELISNDWGGQGIFTSQVIDVTGISVVDITATGVNAGANENNFTYFYILDGGSRVETPVSSSNGDPVNYSVLSLDVTGATSLEVGFEFSENGSNDGYDISEFLVVEGSADTSVQFTTTSDTVLEDAGSYDLTFEIAFEDAVADTTFDVVLTAGDAADLGGYTTQSVTFPGGTSGNQTVTVTITDDMDVESNETFTFEIQNVAGGNNAAVGINNSFDLTITDNDGTNPLPGDIVISEIMYNSSGGDDEWIELYNASGSDITLDASWELTYNGNTFNFAGTVITDGDYLTVALGSNGDGTYNNDNPFTPDVATIATPVETTNDSNNLVNSSATIALVFEPGGANVTVDTVTYDDGAPWPTAADGNGPSLELIDVAFDNTDGNNWVASGSYNGGTPGAAYVAPVIYTFNGSWSPSDPSGAATAGDDIIIASGNASIASNTTCNSVTVNPGASLDLPLGVVLTANNGLTLESTSTSYSSMLGNGTVAGTVQYERFTNSNALGNDLVSAPLGGQSWQDFIGDFPNFFDLLDDGGTPTTYAFGPFDKTTGLYVNYDENTLAPLTSGVGYRAATTGGDNLVYTGTPVTGAVAVPVENAGPIRQEWNLVGNPYASYMTALSFLTTNNGVFNVPTFGIWGYDGNAANGWSLLNLANTLPTTVIAPGQGFFVSVAAPTDTINFDPSWRTSGSSDDFIPGRLTELQYLVLNIISGDRSFYTDFYFNSAASEGFDAGYDAESFETITDFGIYSHLVQDNNGAAMARQSLNNTSLSDITIPLGVHADQGEQITFSISETTLPNSVNVYLDDVVANTTTLLNNTDYVITPASDLSGTGRFFLRYSEDALSTIDNDIEDLNIFALSSSKEIVVSGQLQEDSKLELYDIQGRTVLSTGLDTDLLENRINVSALSAGVYVVSVQNNAGQKTQKVILK